MAQSWKTNPIFQGLKEFLLHDVKYAFPAERGEGTRGMPTSYSGSPLKYEIAPGDDLPPVLPWRDGDTRGSAPTSI